MFQVSGACLGAPLALAGARLPSPPGLASSPSSSLPLSTPTLALVRLFTSRPAAGSQAGTSSTPTSASVSTWVFAKSGAAITIRHLSLAGPRLYISCDLGTLICNPLIRNPLIRNPLIRNPRNVCGLFCKRQVDRRAATAAAGPPGVHVAGGRFFAPRICLFALAFRSAQRLVERLGKRR